MLRYTHIACLVRICLKSLSACTLWFSIHFYQSVTKRMALFEPRELKEHP